MYAQALKSWSMAFEDALVMYWILASVAFGARVALLPLLVPVRREVA